MITKAQFLQLFPRNKDSDVWCDLMTKLLPQYGIDNPKRVSAFIAQCGHESAGFSVLSENLNYSANGLLTTFGKYFNQASALDYQRKPERIANRVYANRMNNGNEQSGDGWKYRGRGLIQLTGKTNYTLFDNEMYVGSGEIVSNPQIVSEDKSVAILSAVWFWNKNNLNALSDKGDIKTMTRRINGGSHGLAERTELYTKALSILSK